MAEIAIVDKQPSGTDYSRYFDFKFDQYHLSSIRVAKLLKKDIDLDISQLEPYKYVILVGSEAAKVIAKVTSVTENSGHLIDKRYIPLISPAMAAFKPEAGDALKQSVDRIKSILEGSYDVNTDGDWAAIQDEEEAWGYLTNILEGDAKVVALDTETTALYPRDGYILGMSISAELRKGAYIDSDAMSDRNIAAVQDIIDTKQIVMHNAKFDVKFMEYHYGLKFNRKTLHDTLILHYLLDETQGSHGLKTLALKYTKYGDYDKDLEEYKNFYCKQHGILKDEFNYSYIPFDIISKYAAIDTAVTLDIFSKFYPIVSGSFNLNRVYSEIMMPGLFMLIDIEEAGIPLAKDRLLFAQGMLESRITAAKKKLYSYEELQAFEKARGDIFNPNSVVQLRSLLFDYLNLTPTGKKTATGAISTDAEVLEELQNDHPIVGAILEIRKLTKIKNTYIDKLLPQIDRDGRIRTGFMMTSTTSGRLSSSGKFNAQQIVRDDPIVKGCIVARPGYKIVSQDLATAEMYYAATLSGDKALISVFDEGGDFHSAIAKMVFRLPCSVEEVKSLYKDKRQAAKAIN
jgi:DNA polymerase I-like protein with 3'-5' exonuclease and polymerase domains